MNPNELSQEEVLLEINKTPAIVEMMAGVSPIAQEWSASSAFHFTGIHRFLRVPVLLKVGISQNELFWTEEISRQAPHLVPTLFLSDHYLGELDLAWKVVEAAQGGVLGPQWGGREFEMLLEAGVEFQRVAQNVVPPLNYGRLHTRTAADVRGWLLEALPDQPPGPSNVLLDRLEDHFAWVDTHCETVTCHGDLHMCNGVTRTGPPDGSVLLIDFAPCRQPWALEAARLQVLNSTDPARVGFQKLVHKMAVIRQSYGLSGSANLDRLECITLAWYAVQMWHLIPERRSIPAYRDLLGHYIRAGASI